jgi:hypothetical protein
MHNEEVAATGFQGLFAQIGKPKNLSQPAFGGHHLTDVGTG